VRAGPRAADVRQAIAGSGHRANGSRCRSPTAACRRAATAARNAPGVHAGRTRRQTRSSSLVAGGARGLSSGRKRLALTNSHISLLAAFKRSSHRWSGASKQREYRATSSVACPSLPPGVDLWPEPAGRTAEQISNPVGRRAVWHHSPGNPALHGLWVQRRPRERLSPRCGRRWLTNLVVARWAPSAPHRSAAGIAYDHRDRLPTGFRRASAPRQPWLSYSWRRRARDTWSTRWCRLLMIARWTGLLLGYRARISSMRT